MRRLLGIILIVAAVLAQPAEAQSKRAFVVGVGDYLNLVDLQKTDGDATGYAQAFRDDLKFDVTRLPPNPTRSQFMAAFGQFLQAIKPGDEVAFVFAGHGWSDGVENYLVLSDAPKNASEYELKSDTVALTTGILRQIQARKPALTLVIIDACRDNPFDTGTMGGFERGLVPPEIIEATLVVFAAGARQKALDRLSDTDPEPYSLFTRKLLPKLKDPNRSLMRSMDETRDEVHRVATAMKHQQRPAIYSDLSLDFCFSGNCAAAAKSGFDADTAMWVQVTTGVRGQDPCQGYQRYRETFPQGQFADRVARLLAAPPCGSQTAAPAARNDKIAASDISVQPDGASAIDFFKDERRIGTVRLAAETVGQPIREGDIVLGSTTAVTVLGPSRSSLLFTVFLDDDRDGYVDRLSQTIWRLPVDQTFLIYPLGSDPGMRRDNRTDCDTYNIAVDTPTGRIMSAMSGCTNLAEWDGPLSPPGAGATTPVLLKDGFTGDGIYTRVTKVSRDVG